jgi:hypothetical protein
MRIAFGAATCLAIHGAALPAEELSMVRRFPVSLGWGADKNGDAVWARDFEAAIRRIQHTVDCHVPVGEVRDILLEMCAQELPSQSDAKVNG